MYQCIPAFSLLLLFFFNDPATTEIYTLSLHDALPIYRQPEASEGQHVPDSSLGAPVSGCACSRVSPPQGESRWHLFPDGKERDRKSTRLNSSHSQISYAVFCLKKKNKQDIHDRELISE